MRKRQKPVDTLPVNLIVGDRLFVVVGGGAVALRKTKLLLAAGARVRVISPEICDELGALADEGRIDIVEREFGPADVDDAFLAFAATSDHEVNLDVLEQCRRAGTLCCPVDKSWSEGDFVTPAIFRQGGLIISVSTGGKSCRRARLVKENLAHHVDLVSTSDLLVMGTSHQHLAVGKRETFHLSGERFERIGEMISQVRGVHEFVLLSTCNRMELAATVAAEAGVEPLLERILGFDQLDESEHYRRRGFDAFGHLALVTAGMLSQSPGEDHIVAQVKDTLDACEQHEWSGGIMRGWIGCALHLSRDIREAVDTAFEAGEIEDICMQYLRCEGPEPANGAAAVIGTGMVGRSVMQRLVEAGYQAIWCYHQNVPEAWRSRVELAPLSDLDRVLRSAQVVFTAVSSPGHIIGRPHLGPLSDNGGAVVFDLGIPRNVAPELDGAIDTVRIVDLDDLKQFHQRVGIDLAAATQRAEAVIEEHRDMYERIIESLQDRDEE